MSDETDDPFAAIAETPINRDTLVTLYRSDPVESATKEMMGRLCQHDQSCDWPACKADAEKCCEIEYIVRATVLFTHRHLIARIAAMRRNWPPPQEPRGRDE